MASFSSSHLPASRDTLWLHRNRQHYNKRDPKFWLKTDLNSERPSKCLGDQHRIENWMNGNFFSDHPSPIVKQNGIVSPVKDLPKPMSLSTAAESKHQETTRKRSGRRHTESSFLHLASKEDQKLVQKILEVLRTHNGHFRRLSWTTTHTKTPESRRNQTTEKADAKEKLTFQEQFSTAGEKRSRRVSFQQRVELRYVDHRMTDYGLPMMTAIPGTGNGTTNVDSEWHNRPHTGWFNKYVGSGNRPRWWFYDSEHSQSSSESPSPALSPSSGGLSPSSPLESPSRKREMFGVDGYAHNSGGREKLKRAKRARLSLD